MFIINSLTPIAVISKYFINALIKEGSRVVYLRIFSSQMPFDMLNQIFFRFDNVAMQKKNAFYYMLWIFFDDVALKYSG
jgi:hypothetical protein